MNLCYLCYCLSYLNLSLSDYLNLSYLSYLIQVTALQVVPVVPVQVTVPVQVAQVLLVAQVLIHLVHKLVGVVQVVFQVTALQVDHYVVI